MKAKASLPWSSMRYPSESRKKCVLDNGNSICKGAEAKESKISCGARVKYG